MSETARPRERVNWVDFGKGFSIILVVLHHAMIEEPGTPFSSDIFQSVDEFFLFMRMPLFFLMAGIFAARSLYEPWPDFINKKLLHFFYLFVLWSVLLYVITVALPYFAWDEPTDRLKSIFRIFYSPPLTLWFIYALMWMFLLTRLLRRIPLWLLTSTAFGVALLFLDPNILPNKSFPQKLIRLYPFFLLGYLLSPYLQALPRYLRPWHLIAVAVYGLLAWALLRVWGLESTPLVITCQLLGAAAGIVIAEMMSRSRFFGFVKTVGIYSLAVYVMHRLVVFALEQLADFVAFQNVEINVIISWVLASVIPILCAKWVEARGIKGIFDRPDWLSVQRFARSSPGMNAQTDKSGL